VIAQKTEAHKHPGSAAVAKVLHVVRSLAVGGAERIVIELAMHGLGTHGSGRGRGDEVCCVVEEGDLAGELRDAGVSVHVLGRGSRFDPAAILKLARLIARGGFSVVHNHGFAALSVGVPASLLAAPKAVVRTEHEAVHASSTLARVASRAMARCEDAQIAVADAVRDSIVADGRIPPWRLITIRSGIDARRLRSATRRRQTRTELGIPDDAVVALSVGTLTPEKDHANLLEAVSRLNGKDNGIVFLIAGQGPLADELAQMAARLKLSDRVRLLGRRLDVPALLEASDIFVAPSAWEGLPVALLEAMAAGVPCVATDVGGVPELLQHGVTGVLVPPRDPEALARGIEALSSDASARERIGRAAMEEHSAHFATEQMVGETEAIYELASRGRADLATKRRITVLFVIGQLGYGGAERQLLELATRMDGERFEPMVCSLSSGGGLLDALQSGGVRVVSLDKQPGIGWSSLVKLARLVRDVRPVVLHSYLFSANWRVLLIGRLLRVPLIVTSVRNVDIHSSKLMKVLERVLSGLTDRVIANAEAVKDYVVRHHGVRDDRVRVIYNGISEERAATGSPGVGGDLPEESGGADAADPRGGTECGETSALKAHTVTIIGALVPKKDHATFLRAARLISDELPGTGFLIVGEGRLRDRLEVLARELGLSDVVDFAGTTEDIAGVLRATDVFVLTSLKEGCANVILESMAAARPVVATDVGGNPELVVEGVTGFVVPRGDAAAVARRVSELLRDDDLRARMGQAGRARALERFTVDVMVGNTTDFYLEVLRRRVPGLVEWVDAGRLRYASRRIRSERVDVKVPGALGGSHVSERATASS
jgi:glycosyltransferase involved in cell wall biosynthesis